MAIVGGLICLAAAVWLARGKITRMRVDALV